MADWWDNLSGWLYKHLGWLVSRHVIVASVFLLFLLLSAALLTQPVIVPDSSQVEVDACVAWSVVGPDSGEAHSANVPVLECSQFNDAGPDAAELAI